MQTCSQCTKEQRSTAFISKSGKPAKTCTSCRKRGAARSRKHYAANPTATRDRVLAWRTANPVAYRRVKARANRAYCKAHPERLAEKNARYLKKYPEKNAARVGAYRARKMQATPAWANAEEIQNIYRLAREHKALTGEPATVDHIVPLKSKLVCGLHWEGNLRLVLGGYNSRKQNKTWPHMP